MGRRSKAAMATTTSSPLVEVGKFEVTVRLMDDLVPEKITPTVHPDEKIGMLVERIQKLAQVQEVTLQYRNEVLQHHCTIGDYGINRESTVYGFPSVNPHPNCRFCLACRKRLMKKKLEMRKQEKSNSNGSNRKGIKGHDVSATVDEGSDHREDSEGSFEDDHVNSTDQQDSLSNEPLIVDSQGKVQAKVQPVIESSQNGKSKNGKNGKSSQNGKNGKSSQNSGAHGEASGKKMSAAERVAAFEANGGFDAVFCEFDDDDGDAPEGEDASEALSFESLLNQMKLEEEATKTVGLTPAQKKRARKKKAKMKENENKSHEDSAVLA